MTNTLLGNNLKITSESDLKRKSSTSRNQANKNYLNSLNEDSKGIIGCFISDTNGKTLLIFEVSENALEDFIKRNFSQEKKDSFNIELIPMFISAITQFSKEIYSRDIIDMKISEDTLRMISFMHYKNYIVTFFLDAHLNMDSLYSQIDEYFRNLFTNYREEFKKFREFCYDPNNLFKNIEIEGSKWLKSLNDILQSEEQNSFMINF